MRALVVPDASLGPKKVPNVGETGDVYFRATPWPPPSAAGLVTKVFGPVYGPSEHILTFLFDDAPSVGRAEVVGLARHESLDLRHVGAADAIELRQLDAPE